MARRRRLRNHRKITCYGLSVEDGTGVGDEVRPPTRFFCRVAPLGKVLVTGSDSREHAPTFDKESDQMDITKGKPLSPEPTMAYFYRAAGQ